MRHSLYRVVSLFAGAVLCVALLAAGITQEVPRGNLHGVLTMKENGEPLPGAWITMEYLGGPEALIKKIRHYESEKDGSFDAGNVPAGVYAIEVDARAHEAKKRIVYIEEGKSNQIAIALKQKDPELELYASQRVFSPGEKVSFQIRGFDASNEAHVTVYRLDMRKIVAKGGLATLLYSFSRPGNEGGDDPSKSSISSSTTSKQLTSKDVEGVFTEPIVLSNMAEGFYFVRCAVGKMSRATYVNVSTIGLVTKSSHGEATCFVTDLNSGAPVAGAAIEQNRGASLVPVAKTNASGLASLKLADNPESKTLVVATRGSSQAVVNFSGSSSESDDSARLFLFSERPIYRPGDTVQFKGYVRIRKGIAYAMPPSGSVRIEIRDSDETLVEKRVLPLSSKGAFHGSFSTNVEDKPGAYSIKAMYGEAEENYWVSIAAYRKPEFTIKVTPTKKYFVYGDRASALVKAEYYFGGPVIGARVEAYISRSTHYSWSDEYADEEGYGNEYDSGPSVGEYREKAEVTTNEKGEALIEFPTVGQGDPQSADSDFDYTVNASITDASNKYFDATGSVLVVRGELSTAMDIDHDIVEPGQAVTAKVTVTSQESGKPVAGRDVVLRIGVEKWAGTEANFIEKQSLTAKTDASGVASFPVTAGSEGSLVLKSEVKDDTGRLVKDDAYVYVSGAGMVGLPSTRFSMTLDKRSYAVGDSCKAMIQTDQPGGSALITVQAEKVLAKFVVSLKQRATIVTIPVGRAYQPNVWVSAVSIRKKQLVEAESRLAVNVTEHDLKIQIVPDKADYLPGETAKITVKTTDAKDHPVPAEISLGVVDESIYAIKSDTTNIMRGFYPMRSDQVRTNYSFESIYLDGGDKAGGNIPVRTRFLDTADFQPSLQTDASGVARTTVRLPDNLTSWRATVVGVSDATQVGIAHVNFRARKPLSVRLELPAFLVQQDSQRITAIVTNDTGKDQTVNVRLDAQGVAVGGQTSLSLSVPAAKPQAVSWDVQTPSSGEARFTVYSWTVDGAKDAEGRTLTVQPHGRLVIETHADEVRDGASATFKLDSAADRSTGRLVLSVSPSMAASLYQSLDDLIGFPYGCTEQTMSRFLPAVVLDSALKEKNLRSDLRAKIPKIVADGFARLAKMQHSNGSWGWWEYDDEDMFMTAYVLDGLKRAKAAGYESDRINTERAVQRAKEMLKAAKPEEFQVRDFLYLAYAVAEYGGHEEAAAAAKRVTPKGASGLALTALIANEVGDTERLYAAVYALRNLAKIEGDRARFENSDWEYGEESAAFPLIALTTFVPEDPLIPMLARHLMVSRRGEIWGSTRDSSLALIGLTNILKKSLEAPSPTDIQVTIGNASPRTIHFDPSSLTARSTTVTVPVNELEPGDNRIVFHVAGNAMCYFTGELRQTVVEDRLLPLRDTAQLSITRNYYLLEPQRLENGGMELRPSKKAIDQARTGDLIRVELTIVSSQDREFMMIEDPIPSGCRITEREYIDEYEEWGYWWTQVIVRDDKAAFFMRELPKGVQKIEYTMRAEQIGFGHALPTTITNMYDPAQSHSGGESFLKVSE